MPKLRITRRHSFDDGAAKARLHALIDAVRVDIAKHVQSIDWEPGERAAKARGRLFKGRFALDGDYLNVDLDVSVVAVLFLEKIRTRIEAKLDEHFSPQRVEPTRT